MDIDIVSKLDALIDLSRMKLSKLLKTIGGTKDITVESSLFRPLERICGVKWLRLNDVEKIYKLEDTKPVHTNNLHVYFIPMNLITFRRVLDQIQSILDVNKTKYHVIIIPKVLYTFEMLLEELGLYDLIQLHSYCWEFIQIDPQILSLETPLFADVFVNEDLSLLPAFSQSLANLFCVVGEPPLRISVGKYSQIVLNQVEMFRTSYELPTESNSDFDACIVMDRSVDYLSALLTSTTYAALLSDVYKVSGGVVEDKQNPDVETPTKSESEQCQQANPKSSYLFILDSVNDSVYADIKNRHISDVSEILSQEVRKLKSEGEASKEMDLSEMKIYVQTKLQQATAKSRSLNCHLKSCEKIIEELSTKFERLRNTEQSCLENVNKSKSIKQIEEFIIQGNDSLSLRLICLLSLTQRLNYDEYNNLKLRYLQQFGYNYLYLFHNMNRAELIAEPVQTKLNLPLPNLGSGRKDFYTISNKLRLIPQRPDLIDLRSPINPSYVFGGCYVPVTIQLVSNLLQAQSDTDFKTKLDLLNGVLITKLTNPFPLKRRNIFVCILGGFTYAEIAAFNLLEKLSGCKIVMCSNLIVSGNDLMQACK